MRSAALFALGLLACGQSGAADGVGRARIVLTGSPDTVRFEVPIVAQTCAGGAGILVHGERRGQGLLAWLRGGPQTDTGTYRLLTRGDTAAPRGVIVSVRFMVGDVAHGFTVDDGSATVMQVSPLLQLHVGGRGIETGPAGPRAADLDFEDARIDPDTVTCRVQP